MGEILHGCAMGPTRGGKDARKIRRIDRADNHHRSNDARWHRSLRVPTQALESGENRADRALLGLLAWLTNGQSQAGSLLRFRWDRASPRFFQRRQLRRLGTRLTVGAEGQECASISRS